MKHLTIFGAALAAMMITGCAVTTAGVKKGDERNFVRSINDMTAGKAIKARMVRADAPKLGGVDVEVAQGVVLLAGTVPTMEDKIEAERIAWSAPSVGQIGNEIRIKRDKGLVRSTKDGVLQTAVRTRLIADKTVKARNINIETHDGVIYLLGVARSAYELERIATIASTTNGAKEVISYIKIHGDDVKNASYSHTPSSLSAPSSTLGLQSLPQSLPSAPQSSGSIPYNVPELPAPSTPQVADAVPDTEPYYRDPVTGERITLAPGTKTIPYRPDANLGLQGVVQSAPLNGPTASAQLPDMGEQLGKAFPTDSELGAFRTGGAGDAVSVIESEPYYIDPTTGKQIPISWVQGKR